MAEKMTGMAPMEACGVLETQVLTLKPDDVLLVKVRPDMTTAEINSLSVQLNALLTNTGARSIVYRDGEVGVVKQEADDAQD